MVLNICSPDPLVIFCSTASLAVDLKTAFAIALIGLASASPGTVAIAAPPAKAGMYRFINLNASIIPGMATEKAPYSKAWTTSSAI